MKRHSPALLVLILAAGCGKEDSSGSSSSSSPAPEWKASTPKEWFESCEAAQQRKEFGALWDKGMSKACQKEAEDAVKGMQDRAKKDKAWFDRAKKELGVGDEWADLSPKDAWVAVVKKEAEVDPEESKYVSDTVDGDKATIKVTEKKLKKKKDTDPDPQPRDKTYNLVKEDGMWKMADLP